MRSVAEVSVPYNASPIEFKPLYVKFRGDIFQIKRGADIGLVIQESMHHIGFESHVDGQRFQTLGLRRNDHAIALRTAGLRFQPTFSLAK